MAEEIKPDSVITDVLGRKIAVVDDVVSAAMGRHQDASAMSFSEARECIERPERIDVSNSVPSRNVYYKYREERGKPPYMRAVTQMGANVEDSDGILISFSRYNRPVLGETIYLNPRNRS